MSTSSNVSVCTAVVGGEQDHEYFLNRLPFALPSPRSLCKGRSAEQKRFCAGKRHCTYLQDRRETARGGSRRVAFCLEVCPACTIFSPLRGHRSARRGLQVRIEMAAARRRKKRRCPELVGPWWPAWRLEGVGRARQRST